MSTSASQARTRRTSHVLEVGGRELSLSNLDKPMYPSGFTKGQAIEFYIKISDYLLPHLKERPITLKRYPNGTTAKHFYEKDAPKYTPKWVKRFPVPRRTGDADICYVLINDLASLVWSVNLANLEMHPFLHRVPGLDKPTAMVFDLDPGEPAGILESAEVAFLLKQRLEDAGLQVFAKVSGSKGIQLYVPLNTPVRYSETQPYARSLAQKLELEYPGLIVSTMAKAQRRKKVFIDWSQNSDFKTTVAPYSLRAKQEQPFVSLPVTWQELARAVKRRDASPLQFTPDQSVARLRKTGDLFGPVLSLHQRLPASAK
jgi:bifunctional non-homologous end joining protein LigD